LCCVFSLVYLLFHCNHALLVVISRVFHCNQKLPCSVNRNPWKGNPFNHSKPKPLGKINHNKPKNWTQKPNTDLYTYTAKLFPFAIVAITAKNYHCHSKESPFFSEAECALRTRFLPNLFARQPIHRKPQPLHFSHKPNTANPYTTNPNPFFPEIGFAVFFSQKPNKLFCLANKTICLVSVKKTQQTHALFLHLMWFSFSVADMHFLYFVHFMCFIGVMCVR